MRLTRWIATLTLATTTAAVQAAAVITSGNLLLNSDFETSNVSSGSYKYINFAATTEVSAPGWTFTGGSGIANRSGAWGGKATSSAVVFLQSYPGFEASTLSQGFTGLFDSLTISFNAAQRPNNTESLRVLLDGVDLSPTPLTPAGADWTGYTFTASNLTARNHRLTFVAVNGRNANDSSLFLDNISVTPNATVPEPGTLALAGAALAGLGFARRRLRSGTR